jgi:crotonobetainyl-CoA:carnitine CoA-transferase CaiB-like acyl-CoA transferase
MISKPLDGVLVADFSRVLAGPLAAATLADLGAEVIKVERPGLGDDTRQWGPPWTANTSAYFECANRSKKSIELDLTDTEDLRVAWELVNRCDVLIENFRPGSLDRLGLGYRDVSAANPGIVYTSITGFGSGAGADLGGYDFLVQALGGLMSITGHEGDPMKVGVALVDVLTSKDAVTGTLAALRVRDQAGYGQHVEVNLLSSLLASLVNQASAFLATGEAPGPLANRHPSVAPYETLRAKDGSIAVCCGNDRQFAKLVNALGASELASDARFATNADRVAHRSELVDLLEGALSRETVASWTERLSGAGLPVGRVGSVADGFALAERLGLEPTVRVGPNRIPQVRNPITFSATPIDIYTAPPRLGEHNADVRRILTEDIAP